MTVAEQAPQAGTSFGLILALWGAGLGAAGQYGKVSVVFDLLPGMYPSVGASLGFAVSLVGLVGIVLGVAAAPVIERFGLRRALVVALWAGAVLSAAQALAPPWPLFVVLRGVEGLSHIALVVAAPTLIARLAAPRHRGFALTLWGTFFGVAFALLAAGGRPLAEVQGVGAVFAAHAAWMAAFALLLGVTLPPDRRAPVPVRRAAGAVADMPRLYRSPRIGAPAAGWVFYTFSFVAFLTLVPSFVPEGWRTLVTAAMPLVSIAVSLTLGFALLRRMAAVQVVRLGFAVSAALALALLAAPGNPVLCLALAGALGLVQGATFASVPELNADGTDRALANGGLAQMGNVGNTLGVPVLAAGIGAFGHAGLALPLAAALAAGWAVHTLLARLRDRMPDP